MISVILFCPFICAVALLRVQKASKGRLNEIDSTEKGEKKRNCRARENGIRVVLSNFLVDLTETKFVGCSAAKKEPGGIQRTTRVYIKPVENVLFR